MSDRVKSWPYGLCWDDFEERLEEMELDWSDARKLRFWKHLCDRKDLELDYQAMTEAIVEEVER